MANSRFIKSLELSEQKGENDTKTKLSNNVYKDPLGVEDVLNGDNIPNEEDDEDVFQQNNESKALDRIQHIKEAKAIKDESFTSIECDADSNIVVPNISSIRGLFQAVENEDFFENKVSIEDKLEEEKSKNNADDAPNEEEEDVVRKKPGPKPRSKQNSREGNEEVKQQKEEKQDEKSKNNEIKNHVDFDNIAEEILHFVCKTTVLKLVETYKSKIYTKEYAVQLMQDYVEGKTKASENPLFKQLILECIESKVVDSYLKEMTPVVLNYIVEN